MSLVSGAQTRHDAPHGCSWSVRLRILYSNATGVFALITSSDVDRVRVLWRSVTRAPDGFLRPGWTLVGADDHQAPPPGWVGIVELLGSVVISVPQNLVDRLRGRLEERSAVEDFTDPRRSIDLFGPVNRVLGPALLFYGQPVEGPAEHDVIGPLPVEDSLVVELMARASHDEREESGLEETTSGVYLAMNSLGVPAAACGWRTWPHGVAHVSVLCAPVQRHCGFGRAAAQVALLAALDDGLLPQWRAAETNEASTALASTMGLQLLGRQLSLQLSQDATMTTP